MTTDESQDQDGEVIAHAATDQSAVADDVDGDEPDDGPDVEAHAGWGSAG